MVICELFLTCCFYYNTQMFRKFSSYVKKILKIKTSVKNLQNLCDKPMPAPHNSFAVVDLSGYRHSVQKIFFHIRNTIRFVHPRASFEMMDERPVIEIERPAYRKLIITHKIFRVNKSRGVLKYPHARVQQHPVI